MRVDIRYPEWFKPIIEQEHAYRHILAHGGRGSGKSWALTGWMILKALSEKCLIMFARDTSNALDASSRQVVVNTLERWHIDADITDRRIVFRNGSEMIFRGLRHPEALKSLEGVKYVMLDEAQAITAKAYKMLLPTVREKGSKLYYSMNPTNEDDAIWRTLMVEKLYDATTLSLEVNWQQNPWFPEVLEEQRQQDLAGDPADYAHIWDGAIQSRTEELVINPRIWRVDELRDIDGMTYFGLDIGVSASDTVGVRAVVVERSGGRPLLYVAKEVRVKGGVINSDLSTFMAPLGVGRDDIIWADHQVLQSYSPHLNIRHVGKTGGDWVSEGLRQLNSCEIVVHPDCQGIIREFKSYRYKVDQRTGVVTNERIKGADHGVDALRYALDSWTMEYWRRQNQPDTQLHMEQADGLVSIV